jgi:hypothetical protein
MPREEEIKKHEYWRTKFEEGSREMRALERPEPQRQILSDI